MYARLDGDRLDEVIADLRKLPMPVPARVWDERSMAEPCFHRVDPGSFGALLEEAAKRSRGFLGIFGRKATHLDAMLLSLEPGLAAESVGQWLLVGQAPP